MKNKEDILAIELTAGLCCLLLGIGIFILSCLCHVGDSVCVTNCQIREYISESLILLGCCLTCLYAIIRSLEKISRGTQ